MKMEIKWIVIWYNTNTIQNQVKQLKIPKKGVNQLQKNKNHGIIFRDSLQDHNIGLILILTGMRTNL